MRAIPGCSFAPPPHLAPQAALGPKFDHAAGDVESPAGACRVPFCRIPVESGAEEPAMAPAGAARGRGHGVLRGMEGSGACRESRSGLRLRGSPAGNRDGFRGLSCVALLAGGGVLIRARRSALARRMARLGSRAAREPNMPSSCCSIARVAEMPAMPASPSCLFSMSTFRPGLPSEARVAGF